MSRYFFHIKDKAGTALDNEGIELDDLDGVRKEAIEGARQVMQVLRGEALDGRAFVVRDE